MTVKRRKRDVWPACETEMGLRELAEWYCWWRALDLLDDVRWELHCSRNYIDLAHGELAEQLLREALAYREAALAVRRQRGG